MVIYLFITKINISTEESDDFIDLPIELKYWNHKGDTKNWYTIKNGFQTLELKFKNTWIISLSCK